MNGNITSVNDGQTTKTYTYDKLNRLKKIQPQTGSKIVYNYDLRGNRITETKTPKFILNNASYTYDLENRLKSVAKGPAITSMSYYADGLRAKKDSSLGSTSYQYNTSGQLIAEAKNSTTVTTNYIWGPDRVLEKKDVSGGEYYYLYNGYGDVVQMVDKNGNVVNNYQHDEWGNITTNNETVSNPFKYVGGVYDEETGLYYLRARYYEPQLGRFLNEDSVEGQVNNPLTLNLYTYCVNNPCLYVDRSGHAPMIYDAGDCYLFSPDEAMLNTVFATYGYIPFVGGWMKDQIAKAYGFTFITDKKIEKAKSNLSLTLDITSQVEKIGNLKSIGKTLGKSLKFLGKAADIIGKAITTLDVVNEAFVNKEWELNQLVDRLFGDELISTTKEGLIEKYVVAISIMKQYVKKGIVDYTSNGVDMITDYSYKEDYINSAKKVINNVDKKNNAWR